MHKKAILILILVTLFTFSNALWNDFLGDDEVVIVENSFYKSWKNFPSLFQKGYLTDSSAFFQYTVEDYHSGSVAYRPVLSATFFMDYGLWQLNAFGYHLTNVLLHLANTILVYFLIFLILKKGKSALLVALLFSVHPIKTEAVCAIGYRADLLSCFFVLSACLFFIEFASKPWSRNLHYGLAMASYALALFSKESAIVFPLLILIYDYCFSKHNLRQVFNNLASRYLGFVLVSLFYLYVYVFIFPNTSLSKVQLIGGKLSWHICSSLWVFAQYVIGLGLPVFVKMIPPLYAPSLQPFVFVKIMAGLGLFVGLILMIFKTYKKNKIISFFLLWFLIALIPVLNIIPLANPMAHRFLYLPSVGFMAVLGLLIDKLCLRLPNVQSIIKVSIIGLFMVLTISLNVFWKNNYTVGRELIRSYPELTQGYSILGREYFKTGEWKDAKYFLNRSAELKTEDPRIYYMLGMSSLDNPHEAEKQLKKSIEMFPHYVSPYLGLGRMYFMQKDYTKAVSYLEKSIALMPTYTGFGYLIQSYIHLKRHDDAQSALEKAREVLQRPKYIQSLEKFVNEANNLNEPIDLGI